MLRLAQSDLIFTEETSMAASTVAQLELLSFAVVASVEPERLVRRCRNFRIVDQHLAVVHYSFDREQGGPRPLELRF